MVEVSTESPTRKRPFNSMSVFRLVGWVAVIVIIIAVMRSSTPSFKERRAARMIEELGGHYTRNNQRDSHSSLNRPSTSQHVSYVNFSDSRVADHDLMILADLPQLQQLVLANTSITDAGLAYLSELKLLGELNLCNTAVTDHGLSHLSPLTQLWGLYLGNESRPSAEEGTSTRVSPITGSGFAHLESLTNLVYLDAINISVKDADLSHLKGMKALQSLRLDGTDVTDAGIEQISALAGLIELSLAHTRVTGAEFKRLKGLHRIHELNFEASDVGDIGMKFLSQLSALERLNLKSTRVTDVGMLDLKVSHGLDQLDLSETQVTDEGLKSIAEMTGLRQVTLYSTPTTPTGRNRLRSQLRDCRVLPDDDEANSSNP